MLQSETAIPLHLAADELGVDSLVAVDIRSWFLKELDVDLPVLKILGGASVGDMLEYVLENISPELIPNVDGESTPSEMNASESESSAVTPLSSATSVGGSAEEKVEEPDLVKASVKATSVELIAPKSSPGAVLDDASDNDSVLRSRPMSFGQSRFWFLQNYLEAKTAFNIVTMMTLEGHLRIEDLRRAVNLVASHHEGLRTKFSIDEQGQPIQSVLAAPRLALQHRDISGSPDQAAQEFERASRHIYDLERGDTMLVSLLSDASSARHYLTIGYHHINMDGISLGILLADLDKAYRGARLAPTLQYPDFSTKQRQAFVSGGMKDEIAFWRKEFDTFPPPFPLLPFSLTTVRRPLTHYRSHKVEVTVDATLAAQIRKVTKMSRVSPFHVYLAVFWVLLTRITGVDDIAIGMADANRTDGSVQGSIGMFLNLLPLRFRTCGQQSFQDAVKEAQSKVRKALAHSRIPFDALLEELKPPRSADAAPLFQTFIGYRQPLPEHPQAFGCKLVEEQYVRGDTAYDVAIDIIDTHEGDASIQLTVPELLYSASDVRVLMTAFLGLLRAFTSNTSLGLNEPPLFPDAEVQKAIQLGRGTYRSTLY